MARVEIDKWHEADAWSHADEVWLSVENRDERVAVKMTAAQAREIAEAILAEADKAGDFIVRNALRK